MNPILPDVQVVVERLKRLPGVTKVVPGSISKSPHQHRPGDMKFIGKDRDGHSLQIRAFSGRGMQNLHVYATSLENLQKSLVTTVPSKQNPNGGGSSRTGKAVTVIPVESGIERKNREQPIYPAVPAPLLAADPVKGAEMVGRLVKIDAGIALNWLERNTRNRPLRNSDIQRYANDMRAGRWMAGGVVLKFAKDGTIINGQHTLWAVVEANVTIEVYVLTNVDPDVVMVEDDHARRRLTDVIRLTNPGSAVGNIHTSLARMLRYTQAWHRGESGIGDPITRQQEMSFLEENMECIDFAVKALTQKGKQRGIVVAAVLAPLARAWHTEDRERLRKFAQVVSTGMVDEKNENAGVLLRNYLLGQPSTAGTMTQKQTTYRRAERALRAYLDRETLHTLRPVTDELFLMPGEKKSRRN